MENLTITAVKRYTTKQDGTPLVSKQGKPYTSIRIKTDKYGDAWVSGFGNPENDAWIVGSEIEVLVEKKGEYLNFSMPKKEDKVNEKLELILNTLTGIRLDLGAVRDYLGMQDKAKKTVENCPKNEYEDQEPPF